MESRFRTPSPCAPCSITVSPHHGDDEWDELQSHVSPALSSGVSRPSPTNRPPVREDGFHNRSPLLLRRSWVRSTNGFTSTNYGPCTGTYHVTWGRQEIIPSHAMHIFHWKELPCIRIDFYSACMGSLFFYALYHRVVKKIRVKFPRSVWNKASSASHIIFAANDNCNPRYLEHNLQLRKERIR